MPFKTAQFPQGPGRGSGQHQHHFLKQQNEGIKDLLSHQKKNYKQKFWVQNHYHFLVPKKPPYIRRYNVKKPRFFFVTLPRILAAACELEYRSSEGKLEILRKHHAIEWSNSSKQSNR